MKGQQTRYAPVQEVEKKWHTAAEQITYPVIDAGTPDAVRVLEVRHWTGRLFSFEVERPQAFVSLWRICDDRLAE